MHCEHPGLYIVYTRMFTLYTPGSIRITKSGKYKEKQKILKKMTGDFPGRILTKSIDIVSNYSDKQKKNQFYQ